MSAAVTQPKPLDIYVVNGKRKPVKIGKTVDANKVIPPEIVHEGTTYYFSNADLIDKTATFTSVPITWQ